jgi:hypothetical protein
MIHRAVAMTVVYGVCLALVLALAQGVKWGVRQSDSWKQCIAKGGDALVASYSMDLLDFDRKCVKEVK